MNNLKIGDEGWWIAITPGKKLIIHTGRVNSIVEKSYYLRRKIFYCFGMDTYVSAEVLFSSKEALLNAIEDWCKRERACLDE